MLTLAGEQSAYEVLVKRYQSAVVSSALSITKSRFMAEDAAQDAFVTAWMKLNTLQEPKKYGSWVCRISKNCALNMISRYRSFLPLDVVDNLNITADAAENPAELYAISEDRDEVTKTVDSLPEKVRQIIQLHYFEDLSIAEIADRMRISAGTVKWHLHDGRKRIRKELCAMNEKYSDTLVQRVMKKVEELKLWQVKNDKSGFEKVYKEVLSEVEELPECKEKQHALADVLMRGWWWLPGKKNDALFARIADAATEGKNEEVMTFIVAREDSKVYGGARIEFMRDKQIPRLEKAGFVKALGREWFWLGYNLFRAGKTEEGDAAYNKARQILPDDDVWHILVPEAKKIEKRMSEHYNDLPQQSYAIGANMAEFRIIDGKLRFFKDNGIGMGFLGSIDDHCHKLFRNASHCDGHFFADVSIGESFIGTDGTRLTFVSENEAAETPAGRFEGCQIWETRYWLYSEKSVCRTYYKDGVGIVRQDLTTDCITTTHLLKAYDIKGGSGLLPLCPENTWEYSADYSPETVTSILKFTVSFVNGDRIGIKYYRETERLRYNQESWLDAVQEIANEYWQSKDGSYLICDVSNAVERAERLAETPMEKAHTKAAVSVVRRIMATDTTFNPEYTATGHWNFFERTYSRKKSDSLILTRYNHRWSFEWKNMGGMGVAEDPLLYNDILGILQDAANCLWSDEWRIGTSPIVEYTEWDSTVKTQISCEDGGTVTTKAGTFKNCFKLCLDIGGMEDGLSYRGGKKVYYFAEGIGIVRTENEYCGGCKTAVYELTSYEGTGEGFMPMADGLMRRYDALDLTDGFVGAAEYTYVADDDGDIVIFADRTGIRELPPPITEYSSIQSEIVEDRLWDEGKHKESRLIHDANNFHLLCHFFGRPSRYWAAQEKAVAWNKYRLKIIEGLGDGIVPDAWLGHYASTSFRTACALFGCGKKDEGYEWLEKAFEAYPKWDSIPDGTEMDVGDPLIYGGIKVVKGKGLIKLPDGTKEPLSYGHLFAGNCSLMYRGMTAPNGWEWFDPVRDEDRFKEYIERAKEMAEKVE